MPARPPLQSRFQNSTRHHPTFRCSRPDPGTPPIQPAPNLFDTAVEQALELTHQPRMDSSLCGDHRCGAKRRPCLVGDPWTVWRPIHARSGKSPDGANDLCDACTAPRATFRLGCKARVLRLAGLHTSPASVGHQSTRANLGSALTPADPCPQSRQAVRLAKSLRSVHHEGRFPVRWQAGWEPSRIRRARASHRREIQVPGPGARVRPGPPASPPWLARSGRQSSRGRMPHRPSPRAQRPSTKERSRPRRPHSRSAQGSATTVL